VRQVVYVDDMLFARHGTLLAFTGGSAIGLSVTDAWAEPLPVMTEV
jgi:hypothetical protein